MSISVKVPTILRTYTGGTADVVVTGATLADALTDLDAQYPGIGARVLDDEGRLRRFVNVYVNDDESASSRISQRRRPMGPASPSSPPSPGADPLVSGIALTLSAV